MERIAVSISHEREYAVAIAFGIRTLGGTFVFPVDIEARLDDRERQVLARMRGLRDMERSVMEPGAPELVAGDGATAAADGATAAADVP